MGHIVKTYTVIAPNGCRFPVTMYQVAADLAATIAREFGFAEIEVKYIVEREVE